MSNRTIKFRGKRLNGEWAYGDLVQYEDGTASLFVGTDEEGFGRYYPINPETVGQFTGLKDIAGRDAYFDDIVKYRDQSGMPRVGVIKDHGYFKGYIEAVDGDDEGSQDGELHPDEPFEIIGNIHENSDTIGGGDNA